MHWSIHTQHFKNRYNQKLSLFSTKHSSLNLSRLRNLFKLMVDIKTSLRWSKQSRNMSSPPIRHLLGFMNPTYVPLLCFVVYFLNVAWGPWRMDPLIFLHCLQKFDKLLKRATCSWAIIATVSDVKREKEKYTQTNWNWYLIVSVWEEESNNMLCPMTHGNAWMMLTIIFPANWTLLAPSNIIKSTICDLAILSSHLINGLARLDRYLVHFLPPFAIWPVQSTISINANGFSRLEDRIVMRGTLVMHHHQKHSHQRFLIWRGSSLSSHHYLCHGAHQEVAHSSSFDWEKVTCTKCLCSFK